MSQLPLYTPLLTPEVMYQWDKHTIEDIGIPELTLIENASQQAFSVLSTHQTITSSTTIVVLAGSGNNGADGTALARHLHNAGAQVLLLITQPIKKISGAAAEHLNIAQKSGVAIQEFLSDTFESLPLPWRCPRIIVDALSGIGLHGPLRPETQTLVKSINAQRAHSFIFSLDIPTGLCAISGFPLPVAVQAHATVTFEAEKPGFYAPGAKKYTGTVHVKTVGIPAVIKATFAHTWQLISPNVLSLPAFAPDMHKGSAGTVLIIGGSETMAGAPLLSALGALRAGAGVVHIACPGAVASSMRRGYPELLVHAVGDDTCWHPHHADKLADIIQRIAPSSIVIGPGMERTPATERMVTTVLRIQKRCPCVVDADALYFLRLPCAHRVVSDVNDSILALLQAHDVLTPHPGEMVTMLPDSYFPNTIEAKTTKNKISWLQRNRNEVVTFFQQTSSATLVLKGAATVVAQNNKRLSLSPFSCPSLAVGGSGDVLAGAIAACLASHINSFDAACLGVYLHGKAGEILGRQSQRGHLAQEIAHTMPSILQLLHGGI